MSSKLEEKIREIIEKPELFEPRKSNGIYLETVPEWQARALEKQLDKIGVNQIIVERDHWKDVYKSCAARHEECIKQRDHAMHELRDRSTEIGNVRGSVKIQQEHIDQLRAQVLDLERDKKELLAGNRAQTEAIDEMARENEKIKAAIEGWREDNAKLNQEYKAAARQRDEAEYAAREARSTHQKQVATQKEIIEKQKSYVERLIGENERLKLTVSATKTLRDELAMAALPIAAAEAMDFGADLWEKEGRQLAMDLAYHIADEGMKRREITVENA